jgi:hypothetical protein
VFLEFFKDFLAREVFLVFLKDFLAREVFRFFELETVRIVWIERLFNSFVSFANWGSV